MAEVKRLVASIVQFLGDQLGSQELTADAKESLEVAIQCLESAYGVSSSDVHLLPSRTLVDIYSDAVKGEPVKEEPQVASEEAKAEAESLKNEGNNLMKLEKFDEALKCYTDAIKLDGKNAVYYCNRAAAYSKLNNHSFALEDCRRAIEIDEGYSKAYGRMGLAYASLNDHFRARECYKKAAELDPQNESYKNNLSIAEEKVSELERQNPFGGMGGAGGLGNFDIGSVLGNPALMNMASQLMQDPNMQNLIGNIMSGGAGGPAAAAAAGPEAPGFDAFLRAGQQFAQQMQSANPELVEQLRSQMGGPPPPPRDDKPDGADADGKKDA